MTKDEALKLALEALHGFIPYLPLNDEAQCGRYDKALAAIKEALAQSEQKPVAFINVEQRKLEWAKYMSWDTPTVVNLPKIPLYTTPPQRTWVEIDDEDWIKALELCDFDKVAAFEFFEAKLKSKNA